MPPWELIVFVAGVAGLLVAAMVLEPVWTARVLLVVRGGKVEVRRGMVGATTRQMVGDILRDAGVARGWITVSPGRRIRFSWNIPSGARQRLRNVLHSVGL